MAPSASESYRNASSIPVAAIPDVPSIRCAYNFIVTPGFGDDWIQASKGHDHLWGNEGNGYLDTSDGIDEPGNVEEIMSAEGIDKCVLDDPGAVAYNCEIMIRLYRKHQEAPKEL
jgi:hypothetical protein